MAWNWANDPERAGRITHDRTPPKRFLERLRALDPKLSIVWDNYLKRWWVLRECENGDVVPVTPQGWMRDLDGFLLKALTLMRVPDSLLQGRRYLRQVERIEREAVAAERKKEADMDAQARKGVKDFGKNREYIIPPEVKVANTTRPHNKGAAVA